MFKKRFKYFITFWYQLDCSDIKVSSSIIILDKKIKTEEQITELRTELKNMIEHRMSRKCNFITISDWKKLR